MALTSFFLVITIPDLVAILQKYTGGLNGLVDIPVPNFLGSGLSNNGLYEVSIVITLLWFVVYRNLVTSRYGVIFRILRQSPTLANSLGYSTRSLKLMAYSMGAFPAGMAGCLFGFISLVVTPSSFDLNLAIGIVAGSLLGGVESVYGIFIAAAALQLGPESSLSFAPVRTPVVYGVFLLIAAILFRNGLGGLGKFLALRLSRQIVGEAGGSGHDHDGLPVGPSGRRGRAGGRRDARAATDERPAARDRRHRQALRRPAGAGRRLARRRARGGHRADRGQRLR